MSLLCTIVSAKWQSFRASCHRRFCKLPFLTEVTSTDVLLAVGDGLGPHWPCSGPEPVPGGSPSPWEVEGERGAGEAALLCEPQILPLPVSLDTLSFPSISPALAAEIFAFPTTPHQRMVEEFRDHLDCHWGSKREIVQVGQPLRVFLWYHPPFCMIVTDFGEWT